MAACLRSIETTKAAEKDSYTSLRSMAWFHGKQFKAFKPFKSFKRLKMKKSASDLFEQPANRFSARAGIHIV
jgi:hypothetical protein